MLYKKNYPDRYIKVRYLILFTFTVLQSVSCYKKVIDLDLNNISLPVVVRGSVTDSDGPHRVRISRPADYYNHQDEYPPVTGAEVTIFDDAGNIDILNETEEGLYETTSIKGVPGRTYFLKIKTGGDEYTASSKMPEAMEIDSLRFKDESDYGNFYSLTCYFTDRAGIDDYCFFYVYVNNELRNEEIYVYSDEFSDGQLIKYDHFDEVSFNYNETASLVVYTFDKAMYECFSVLDNIMDQKDEYDDEEDPAQILFNLTDYNLPTNLSEGAVGYFGAFPVRIYSAVVN